MGQSRASVLMEAEVSTISRTAVASSIAPRAGDSGLQTTTAEQMQWGPLAKCMQSCQYVVLTKGTEGPTQRHRWSTWHPLA